MSRFVSISDFENGLLNIPTTRFTENKLQSIIDEQEVDVLTDLLGCELYEEFISDYDNVPVDEFSEDRFKKIYEPFCLDSNLCHVFRSKGIKDMLMHVIYFEYMRKLDTSKRSTGHVKEINDNSEKVPANHAGLFNKYNKAIVTYKAIQFYIVYNPDSYNYDNFKGLNKQYNLWM